VLRKQLNCQRRQGLFRVSFKGFTRSWEWINSEHGLWGWTYINILTRTKIFENIVTEITEAHTHIIKAQRTSVFYFFFVLFFLLYVQSYSPPFAKHQAANPLGLLIPEDKCHPRKMPIWGTTPGRKVTAIQSWKQTHAENKTPTPKKQNAMQRLPKRPSQRRRKRAGGCDTRFEEKDQPLLVIALRIHQRECGPQIHKNAEAISNPSEVQSKSKLKSKWNFECTLTENVRNPWNHVDSQALTEFPKFLQRGSSMLFVPRVDDNAFGSFVL